MHSQWQPFGQHQQAKTVSAVIDRIAAQAAGSLASIRSQSQLMYSCASLVRGALASGDCGQPRHRRPQ
jgi:hypothetical protein